MRVIGIINWKGGVGKTTVSINTAHYFGGARENLRVLVIDGDKQANATYWFGADPSNGSFSDILMHGATGKQVIQKTRYPNIDIIPSSDELMVANYSVTKSTDSTQHDILRRALHDVWNDYDICIVDNPPDSNVPVLNCMVIMDDIVAVTLPNEFSLMGVNKLQTEIDNYNTDLHLKLSIRGVLVNQYSPGNSEVLSELRGRYHMFPNIRGGKCTQRWLDKVIHERRSIFEIAPNSGYARDLTKYIRKLEEVIVADMKGEEGSVLW